MPRRTAKYAANVTSRDRGIVVVIAWKKETSEVEATHVNEISIIKIM